MGFLDSIFGGGDAPPIQQQSTLSGGQEGTLNAILSQLQGLIPQGLTPVGPQQIAGASPLQQQAFGQLGGIGQQGFGIANQMLDQFDPSQAQGFLGQAGNALTQGLQGVDTQSISDAFAPSRQLAMNQFEQSTIPNLLERFGASSGGSGALQQQLANAGGNLSLGLAAQQAPFVGQAALNAPGQQFQGAGLAGNLAQLPGQLAGQGLDFSSSLMQQLLNAGGQQRGIAQDPLTAAFQAAQQPSQLLSQFAPLGLGTQAFENFQQQQQPGLLQSLLPAIGGFAGAGGFSGLGSAIGGGLSNLSSGVGGFLQNSFGTQNTGFPGGPPAFGSSFDPNFSQFA